VFVVASAREGFDPASVLFEFDSVRRDSAPSRQQEEDPAGTVRASAGRRGGVQDECGLGLQPVKWPAEVTATLNAAFGSKLGLENQHIAGQHYSSLHVARCLTTKTRIDAETETLIPTIGGVFVETPIAFDSCQDCVSSTEVFGAPGSSSPQAQAVSYAIQAGALRTNPHSGPDGIGVQESIAYTLEARAEVQAVAFSCKDYGADAAVEVAPTMRAMGHSGSHANAGGQLAVALPIGCDGTVDGPVPPLMARSSRGGAQTLSPGHQTDGHMVMAPVCVTGDITHTLKAEGFDASEDGTGRGQPIVAAFQSSQSGVRLPDTHATLEANNGPRRHNGALVDMAVRRLTPRECERLQGFPDDYTLIPGKRKNVKQEKLDRDYLKYLARGGVLTYEQCMNAAADGPRYKALGNSWAVPNVRWIGRRIDAAIRKHQSIEKEAA
jgi:DNA (cytosine-5)-methyltransferase 1